MKSEQPWNPVGGPTLLKVYTFKFQPTQLTLTNNKSHTHTWPSVSSCPTSLDRFELLKEDSAASVCLGSHVSTSRSTKKKKKKKKKKHAIGATRVGSSCPTPQGWSEAGYCAEHAEMDRLPTHAPGKHRAERKVSAFSWLFRLQDGISLHHLRRSTFHQRIWAVWVSWVSGRSTAGTWDNHVVRSLKLKQSISAPTATEVRRLECSVCIEGRPASCICMWRSSLFSSCLSSVLPESSHWPFKSHIL